MIYQSPSGKLDAVTGGVFIAVEGGDGAGKSLQIELLAGRLRAQGIAGVAGGRDLVLTREPGGTALGTAVRQLLLHGEAVNPVAEALLYAADRAQHVSQVIGPALAAGAVVISDRFVDSSLAYQAAGRGLGLEPVKAINRLATQGLVPDLTVVLNLSAEIAAKRRTAGGRAPDRLESAGSDFHQAVVNGYMALAALAPERYAVVEASGEPQPVADLVWAAVARLFEGAA